MAKLPENTLNDMKTYIETLVAEGFLSDDDIASAAIAYLGDTLDDKTKNALYGKAIVEMLLVMDRHREVQKKWPPVTDCDRLDAAFAELEHIGIISRQHYSCCGTCGAAEIQEEMARALEAGRAVKGYTFYHVQDTESATEGHGLHLSYGAADGSENNALRVAHEIVEILKKNHLNVRWDGSWQHRIGIEMDWKRRRYPQQRGRDQ